MSNHEIKYKASLDIMAKVITAACMLVIAVTVISLLMPSSSNPGAIVASAILLPLVIISYMYSVKLYILTDDSIIIKRPLKMLDKKILLSDVDKVTFSGKNDALRAIRKMAIGGVFGYCGLYWSTELGNFTMYATNRNNRVIIKIKNGKIIVVTPDDATMAGEINKRLASA